MESREQVPAPAALLSLRASGSILLSEKLSLCLSPLLEQCYLRGGVSLRGWALAEVQGSATGSLWVLRQITSAPCMASTGSSR